MNSEIFSTVHVVLNLLFGAAAVICATPLLVIAVQCLAALAPRHRNVCEKSVRPKIAILVPAHNEQSTLPNTLPTISRQMRDDDRLIVIADNCSDDTAVVARALGAQVVERNDPTRHGKGFAMDFGMKHLADAPPAVVVFVDADCRLEDNALDALSFRAATTGRPVQALYLMDQPSNAMVRDRISAWAFMLKNLVRPTGLDRLGLHCPLFGTGMAFPYSLLQRVPLADGQIVEDLVLGLNLITKGAAPLFCSQARVLGQLAPDSSAAMTQRERWEHGHVQVMARHVPRLLIDGIRKRRLSLIAAALDLAVPPLSLLGLQMMMGVGLLVIAALMGFWKWPFILLTSVAALAAVSLLAAYIRYGRGVITPATLLGIPGYVLWKLPIYLGMLLRPQKRWVQTPRTISPATAMPEQPGVSDRGRTAPARAHLPRVRPSSYRSARTGNAASGLNLPKR